MTWRDRLWLWRMKRKVARIAREDPAGADAMLAFLNRVALILARRS